MKRKDLNYSKEYYRKRKERDPDFLRNIYQRRKERDPDYTKKLYQKRKEKDPDHNKKKYQKYPIDAKLNYHKFKDKNPDYQKKYYYQKTRKTSGYIFEDKSKQFNHRQLYTIEQIKTICENINNSPNTRGSKKKIIEELSKMYGRTFTAIMSVYKNYKDNQGFKAV